MDADELRINLEHIERNIRELRGRLTNPIPVPAQFIDKLDHGQTVFFMLRKAPSGKPVIVHYSMAESLVPAKASAEQIVIELLKEYVVFLKQQGEKT